jgi:hypothetical protein
MVFLIKLVGTVVLHGIALEAPQQLAGLLDRLSSVWSTLVKHRAAGIVAVFMLALGGSAVVNLHQTLPGPGTHDEFSYLLAADTFLHGRLANPTHPLWPFFESMHIIQQPTYASKYPPAQGLILAMGIVLFGHPMAGVWVSLALACAATCWMLLAWVPQRWALFGGVLMALHLSPGTWAQGYWGGAVAALGGALVFGALRRLVRGGRWRHGLILGTGLGILANSRPFEGLVASLPVVAVLGSWAWQRRQSGSRWEVVALLAPALVVAALTGAWMAWYNYRVTGNPLRLPYQVHDATYAAAPLFLCQAPPTELPVYRHQAMREYYVDWELGHFLHKHVGWGFNTSMLSKVWHFIRFFVGPVFFLPLLVIAWHLRERWTAFAAITCGLVLLALSQTLYLHPHYAAPVTALVIFLIVQGFRHLEWWEWHGRRVGRVVVSGTVALLVLLLLVQVAERLLQGTVSSVPQEPIASRLQCQGGRHLVIVRYGPNHDFHKEWVYNGADIDGSAIVWARDMGPAENHKLVDYFRDRQAWIVEVDELPGPLQPY